MSKAVEQGGGHLCITEDHSPFAEAQVGGDHDASALVELVRRRMIWNRRPNSGAEVLGSSGLGYAA